MNLSLYVNQVVFSHPSGVTLVLETLVCLPASCSSTLVMTEISQQRLDVLYLKFDIHGPHIDIQGP